MKKIYILLALSTLLLVGCTKYTGTPQPTNYDWMHSREKGVVAYVDYYTGNYIVDTYNGYAVIQLQGGVAPRVYDEEYAYFSNTGMQTAYNYSGDYFTNIRVVDSWLTWDNANYLLNQISQ